VTVDKSKREVLDDDGASPMAKCALKRPEFEPPCRDAWRRVARALMVLGAACSLVAVSAVVRGQTGRAAQVPPGSIPRASDQLTRAQHDLLEALADGKDRLKALTLIRSMRKDQLVFADGLGRTPMTLAAKLGDLKLLQALLDAGVGIDDTGHGELEAWNARFFGRTALMAVAEAPAALQVPTIEYLLQQGADINRGSDLGETALNYALRNRKPVAARALLGHGARIDMRDRVGDTEHGASWCTLVHIVSALHGDDAQAELAEQVLAKGPSQRDKDEALGMAAMKDNAAMVKLLLDHSANPNYRYGPDFGFRPGDSMIWRAATYGHWDILDLLVSAGGAADSCQFEMPPSACRAAHEFTALDQARRGRAPEALLRKMSGSDAVAARSAAGTVGPALPTGQPDPEKRSTATVAGHQPVIVSDLAAIGGMLRASIELRTVDAEAHAPVTGAHVLMSEYTTVYHAALAHGSSDLFCYRSGAAQTGTGSVATIPLPPVPLTQAMRVDRSTSHRTVLAYAPGFCAVSTQPGWVGASIGGGASGGQDRIALKRSRDTGEYRLRYLSRVATAANSECRYDNWTTEGLAGRSHMLDAIVAEAGAIAKTPIERYWLQRIRNTVDPTVPVEVMPVTVYVLQPKGAVRLGAGSAGTRPPWSPHRVTDADRYSTVMAAAQSAGFPGWASLIRMRWEGWQFEPAFKPVSSRLGIYCAGGPLPTCDFNERDERGWTHLMRSVADHDLERLSALLEAGADPNVENSEGQSALDLLMVDVEKYTGQPKTTDLLPLIDRLVADPRTKTDESILVRLGGDDARICSDEWTRRFQAQTFCAAFVAHTLPAIKALALRQVRPHDCALPQ
jgi:ankyrin repeat protein